MTSTGEAMEQGMEVLAELHFKKGPIIVSKYVLSSCDFLSLSHILVCFHCVTLYLSICAGKIKCSPCVGRMLTRAYATAVPRAT